MYHPDKFAHDLVVVTICALEGFPVPIPTAKSHLGPDLRLGGLGLRIAQFAHEGSLVSSLPPGFSYVGAYGTRRATDLINEGEPLLSRETLCQFKDSNCALHGHLVHVQITIGADQPLSRHVLLSPIHRRAASPVHPFPGSPFLRFTVSPCAGSLPSCIRTLEPCCYISPLTLFRQVYFGSPFANSPPLPHVHTHVT